jgi:alkyl hydroperoxide reductase subunit AhpF
MYDLIIVGGGPAGMAAGIYAARKKINTLLLTDGFGGQSVVSDEIQNWIGIKSISGYDLAKSLEEHLRAQEGSVEIVENDLVESVEKTSGGFKVKTKAGKNFESKYLLVASGSRRKKMGVPGEDRLNGKGVAYCSTCDAPLFKNKVVAVVGGGNAGLGAVVDLLPYASKIYLIMRSEGIKGDPVIQDKIKNSLKVEVLAPALTQEILGGEFVSGLMYKDAGGEAKELKLDGVFVEVGTVPNSDIVQNLVKLNERREIIVDPKTEEASCPGIWAVGDASDVLYKQNNVSVGDAIKAVLNVYEHLNKQ